MASFRTRCLPLALVAFMAACTGVDRAIHLHVARTHHASSATDDGHHSDPCWPQHDSRRCRYCHELTVGALAVVDAIPPPVVQFGVLAFLMPAPAQAPVLRDCYEPFVPRGPPSIETTTL